VHALPCFDWTGNTEQNERVFDLPNELITTAEQVLFVLLNLLGRMKNSTNTRLDLVVRNDIRTISRLPWNICKH
jgi:hypothetical protein